MPSRKKKISAIIQARMASTRLPGKVLQDICGQPLLGWIIQRLQKCETLDVIAVATSMDPSDDLIFRYCEKIKIPCFRGEMNDVLGRYLFAAEQLEATHIVRVTGDVPFVDAGLIDRLVNAMLVEEADLARCSRPVVHEGIDPCSVALLKRIAADDPKYREHPLGYAWDHPGFAKIAAIDPDPFEAREGYHFSVDNVADLEFTRRVYSHFLKSGSPQNYFSMRDALVFLDAHPEVRAINQKVKSNQACVPAGSRTPRIAILLDGGEQRGFGHLVRMKQLAKELNSYFNCAVYFIAPDNPVCHQQLDNFGLPVMFLPAREGNIPIQNVISCLSAEADLREADPLCGRSADAGRRTLTFFPLQKGGQGVVCRGEKSGNAQFSVKLSPRLKIHSLPKSFGIVPGLLDAIIIDRQSGISADDAVQLKQHTAKLVVIDCASEELTRAADLIILPNLHAADEILQSPWWKNNPEKCLAGSEYVILREAFRFSPLEGGLRGVSCTRLRFIPSHTISTAADEKRLLLLSVGGTDPHDLLEPLIERIQNLWHGETVVLAGAIPKNRLQRHAANPRIQTIRPASDFEMVKWMDGAALAVSAFGIVCYELLARGVPMIVLPHGVGDGEAARNFCERSQAAVYVESPDLLDEENLQAAQRLKREARFAGESRTARAIYDLLSVGGAV